VDASFDPLSPEFLADPCTVLAAGAADAGLLAGGRAFTWADSR
jgi:hypothetical protein